MTEISGCRKQGKDQRISPWLSSLLHMGGTCMKGTKWKNTEHTNTDVSKKKLTRFLGSFIDF
jgi:hypothetical protein